MGSQPAQTTPGRESASGYICQMRWGGVGAVRKLNGAVLWFGPRRAQIVRVRHGGPPVFGADADHDPCFAVPRIYPDARYLTHQEVRAGEGPIYAVRAGRQPQTLLGPDRQDITLCGIWGCHDPHRTIVGWGGQWVLGGYVDNNVTLTSGSGRDSHHFPAPPRTTYSRRCVATGQPFCSLASAPLN